MIGDPTLETITIIKSVVSEKRKISDGAYRQQPSCTGHLTAAQHLYREDLSHLMYPDNPTQRNKRNKYSWRNYYMISSSNHKIMISCLNEGVSNEYQI